MAADKPTRGTFSGSCGQTRVETVHVSCSCGRMHTTEVVRAVNVASDEPLARQLLSSEGEKGLNRFACPESESKHRLDVAIAYHDPAERLFCLVIPDSQRHREFAERAALCELLAHDRGAPVPDYVRFFDVVFGGAGLRSLLNQRAEMKAGEQKMQRSLQQLEESRQQLKTRSETLARRQREVAAATAELDKRSAELTEMELALQDRRAALRKRREELLAQRRAEPMADVTVEEPPAMAPAPSAPRVDSEDEVTNFSPPPTSPNEMPTRRNRALDAPVRASSDSAVTANISEPERRRIESEAEGETRTRRQDRPSLSIGAAAEILGRGKPTIDTAVRRWLATQKQTHARIIDGVVHLSTRGQLRSGALAGDLRALLQLHPLASSPIISFTLAPPMSLAGAGPHFCLDIGDSAHRAALDQLRRDFHLVAELFAGDGTPLLSVDLRAPLAANVAFLVTAADDARKRIPPGRRSFARALTAFDRGGHDHLGLDHPLSARFDESALQALDVDRQVLIALQVAEQFSCPEGEEYLVTTRGYPLTQWHGLRRKVLNRAVTLGLCVDGTLAQVAVSEGLARSRKDLVANLQRNFARRVADGDQNLDDRLVQDNWQKLDAEAARYGDGGSPRSEPIDSESHSVASGLIRATWTPEPTPVGTPAKDSAIGLCSIRSLILDLTDRDRRLAAALELCQRGDPSCLQPLFDAIFAMSRLEASRALAGTVRFGSSATPHLLKGLTSRRGFIRHGCALALAQIGDEECVESLSELIFSEPSRVWREVARAIGKLGAKAVMPLMARLAGRSMDARERAAWALAHVAAQSGERTVSLLIAGRNPVISTVARRALELRLRAARDAAELDGGADTGPDGYTVNRSFTRQFYDQLNANRSPVEVSQAEFILEDGDLMEAVDLA